MKRLLYVKDHFNEKYYKLDQYSHRTRNREFRIHSMSLWVNGIYFRSLDSLVLADDEKYFGFSKNNMPEPFKKR